MRLSVQEELVYILALEKERRKLVWIDKEYINQGHDTEVSVA